MKQIHTKKNKNHHTVIDASRATTFSYKEVWQYRELFLFLAWRDILVRYKQTVLGFAWVVLRPLLMMAVFSLLFGRIANLSSHGIAYPVFVFSALLPWQFFSDNLLFGGSSLVTHAPMLSKIYFPRIFIPLSCIACSFIDFFIATLFLFGLMIYYAIPFSYTMIFSLFFLLWCLIFSAATTLFFAALTVRYRDFKYVVAFLVQLGLYISPVGFSSQVIPVRWRMLYACNPMVSIIDGFRWAFFGYDLYMPGVYISLLVTVCVCVISFSYFVRSQDSFVDVI